MPGSRRCAPTGMKIVLVAVGDHDPGEIREDPGVLHRVQAPGAQPEAEYRSVNAPWTYFFSPAGPDRSVVSSNPATAAAVIRVRISRTTLRGQGRRLPPGRNG